jgi:hypothetical protein
MLFPALPKAEQEDTEATEEYGGSRSKDKLTKYRGIIRRMILDIAKMSERGHVNDGIATVPVCDDRRGQYLLIDIGWQQGRRVRGTRAVKGREVLVDDDMTDLAIAHMLVEGVPRTTSSAAFNRLTGANTRIS